MNALTEYQQRRELDAQRKASRKRCSIPSGVLDAKVTGHACRMCPARMVEAHHLVPRSKFATGDPTVNQVDNLIPLCHQHHQDHHTTTQRIPRSVLTELEALFVFEHTSESWIDLWYPEDAS